MRVYEGMAERTATCDLQGRSRLSCSAHEFEAQLMKELLQPLCKGDDHDEEQPGDGCALATFAAAALGNGISRAGGFGVAERIVRELSRDETERPDASDMVRGPETEDLSLK